MLSLRFVSPAFARPRHYKVVSRMLCIQGGFETRCTHAFPSGQNLRAAVSQKIALVVDKCPQGVYNADSKTDEGEKYIGSQPLQRAAQGGSAAGRSRSEWSSEGDVKGGSRVAETGHSTRYQPERVLLDT